MNTNLISSVIQVYGLFNYAIQLRFTGTPTGSFKLEASTDPAAAAIACGLYTGVNAPVQWTAIKNSSKDISAAGDITWNVGQAGYNWVRVVYTDGSSGMSDAVIITSVFNGKGF